MRAFLAVFAALLAPFVTPASAQTSPFPPSPKQLVAVNPVTNKVYVANEFANSVTVLDQTNNTTTTIPVGNRPQFVVVNPLTNRIFVNNGGEASLTVIDGATDTNLTPTPLQIGSQGPMAINNETNIVYIVRMTSVATDEVTFFNASNNTWYTIATESFQPTALATNPVTNTLYVAHYGTGDVRVISGEFNNTNLHPATFSIGAWSKPFAIAANSMTNKIYVLTEDSRGPIGVINGATNAATWPTPAAGHASGPKALAVNPVTNRIYAAFANEVVVIDGGNNSLAYVPVPTGSTASIAINYFTNKIYVSSDGGNLTVIDGFSNATTALAVPAGTISIGMNPMTNEIITGGSTVGAVDGVTAPFIGLPLTTTINPLPDNSGAASGTITMSAANGFPNPLPVRGVYYQFDSIEGRWSLASGAGNGPWTAPLSGLSGGSHTIYAFAAEAHMAPTDTGNGASPMFGNITSYAFSVTAGGATVNLASSVNPSTVGQSVTFTASVTGSGATPTGTVAFTDGATTLCPAVTLASGSATCTTASLAAGSHTIGANYSGDSNYAAASASLVQTVNKRAATVTVGSTPNPSTTGQAVTITATVAGSGGTPTGTVSFLDGATTICGAVTLASGSATCSTSSLSTGAHTLTVNYAGNATYNTATGSTTQNVGTSPATVAVASSVNPSSAGQAVTFTATVSGSAGTPTGTVNFTDGATTLCPAVSLASGSAACTTNTLSAGSHTITASYSGSTTYGAASGTVTQAVNKVNPTVTGSASPNPADTGAAVTLTAILAGSAGAPTGTVDFLEGTTAVAGCSARPISGDRATCTVSSLSAGSHSLTARYSGNATYNAATSAAFTVTINCANCPPPAPALIAPSGTITTQTPTYSWSASPGATSYYLLVQNTQGVAVGVSLQASGLGCGAGTGTCSVTPGSSLTNNTSYVWFVNASNANGTGAWSAGKEIFVSAAGPGGPPAAPVPVSPSGTINTTTPTYTWNASAGATSYYLLVQNTSGVAVSMTVAASAAGCATGSTCAITPATALANNSMYNWFVNASNAQGTSAWSTAMQIQVSAAGSDGPPVAPTLVAPDGTVNTTTPTYTWNAAAGATSYYLLVQNTSGVAVSMVVDAASAGCSAGGTCSVTPPNALANGATYSWFVNASNRFGTSAWSAGKSVTPSTTAPSVPATPTTISPNGTTTRTPTYTWNASAGATSYYLLVQNTSGVAVSLSVAASAAGCGGGTGTCSVTPSTMLAAASSYAWFVNASNSVGTSAWSDGRMINTP